MKKYYQYQDEQATDEKVETCVLCDDKLTENNEHFSKGICDYCYTAETNWDLEEKEKRNKEFDEDYPQMKEAVKKSNIPEL